MNWSIAIHGGAGTISRKQLTPEKEQLYLDALNNALVAGKEVLNNGGSALDAVCASVVSMENTPLFNAGKGSVFNYDGNHEMDASLMEGKNRLSGAVTGVHSIKNPILLSKAVMEKSEHVFLSGKGAEEFARLNNIHFESAGYFYDEYRFQQWQSVKGTSETILDHSGDKKFGTVGAVAKDTEGNLASATSTGGMTNKRFGRIGDTPMIGAGTWADNNTCAVSCTGHGEIFMRWAAGYDIACLMEYKGWSLAEATHKVVHEKLKNAGGEGGVIAVDNQGLISIDFNSEGMYRGAADADGREEIMIYAS